MQFRKLQVALILIVAFIGSSYLEERDGDNSIARKVWNFSPTFQTNLLQAQSKVVGMFEEENEIPVTASWQENASRMSQFKTIQSFLDGYVITYDSTLSLSFPQDGLITYTGQNKNTGKTISIEFADDTSVTIGLLDHFEHLPYSAVSAGEYIASLNGENLYIQVQKDGKVLSKEETAQWLIAQDGR
ncbi:hypothetical protein [Paenisporosarcina cavernae]|uniref:Peptidase M23 domain-containing protein n=1 Tax=Paenisporosarcina cavernae TaxID=2320858 RepID=A0A385YW61_9BACL|nr:hypothetical protein [Paenisporosarcina cavernae]AYC29742.1 hypothetical protein D3873_07490 [Paenisporosarcina cavernae]